MPSFVQWISTPNKTDHLTPGFTSKVIYNYQYTGNLTVGSTHEVFSEITAHGKQYKGTNILPQNYFINIDDGRTFKISMYFLKPYDGNPISLIPQLYDIDNHATYDFNFDFPGDIISDSGNALVKFEWYLSYFVDLSGPDSIASSIGSMIYASKPPGLSAYMMQLNAANSLSGGPAPSYAFQIYNDGSSTIYPTSLIIEEIS